ncbi:flagellum-specific ATP synthase FliI, partial (plasmid) [Azospirillum humicireducens]
MPFDFDQLIRDIDSIPDCSRYGRVTAVSGLMVEVGGIEKELSVGGRCIVETRDRRRIPCEVVGFRQGRALAMPFGALDGVGLGCRALVAGDQAMIYPTDAWLGRVVNALGEPVDGKGPLPKGPQGTPIRNNPPNAHSRARVGEKLDLGIRAINAFLTCCRGQRMGIFAGSGVGKSSVMSMLARFSAAEVAVIGLIGERGRELQEFITEDLGEEGLARSVVVCATSDEAPLMRKQAAYMTLAVAEHFRDQGR